MRAFVDTNVFVHAVDRADPEKRRIARTLLAERPDELVLSAQVLSEFYVVTTRRLAEPLTPEQAAASVDRLSELPVVPVDAGLVREAIRLSHGAQISYWDGLILAAARSSGCGVVLTEDLSPGATLGGIEIENPFAP